jgi:Asp-tRNA(Asn)/Glu-tRNA(Gln) amidotransferase A subunit family amidase
VQFDVKEYTTHSNTKLRIGVVKSYDLLEATPASQRAVEVATRILESQGHQVVPVEIPDLDQIVEEFHIWYQAEGNFLSLSEFLQGEEEGPSYKVGKKVATSKIVRTLTSCLTKILAPRLYIAVKNSK